MNLTTRDRHPEQMDQPELDYQSHLKALNALRRLNRIALTAELLFPVLETIFRENRVRTFRVLDIATGGGDLPIRLTEMAERRHLPWIVDGCDFSQTALDIAADRARQAGLENQRFFQRDLLRMELPLGYDVLICSQFLHHLSEAEAVLLLQKMRRATRHSVIVHDLIRSRMGYFMAEVVCHILTRSPVIQNDGPLSVRAAFQIPEVRRLAEGAGLNDCRITQHWPQRFLLTWKRSQKTSQGDPDSYREEETALDKSELQVF